MKIGKIEVNLINILVGIIMILGIALLIECNSNWKLKVQADVDKQNYKASTDSIRIIKNKWNEEISLKNTLIAEKKELRNLNESLYNDLKKLEGKVLYISSIISEIKNKEPIVINNTVKEYPNGIRELSWKYKKDFDENNSRTLEGNSSFMIDTTEGIFTILDRGTTIEKDEMKIKLITGLTELDDSYQIYVKTDYPGMKFTNIEGAVLDKKRFMKIEESTWVFGPSIYMGLGVDPLNRTAGPQIGAGVSLTYNLKGLVKKIFKK